MLKRDNMKKIIEVIKQNKDKILHFLGCAIGVFVISRFLHMDYRVLALDGGV